MRKLVLLTLLLVFFAAMVPAAAQDAPTLHIRVAHFSPDAPAVDIYLNGAKTDITGLEFGQVSAWVEIPARTYQVAVVPTEGGAPAIGPATFELPADAWLTIAAVGTVDRGTLRAAVIAEDYSPLADGEARVTVFHGIQGLTPVDVIADGATLVDVLAFPGALGSNDGAAIATVPAGVYNVQVTATGDPNTVYFDVNPILVAGNNTLIAAIGTPSLPELVVIPTKID